MAERVMERLKDKIRSARQPLLIFFLLSLSIVAVGWLYSFYHLREHRKEITRDLESVASLKENQIDSWLAERMSDAQNIIDNPYIGERVGQLFREPYSENIGLDRLKWMRSLQNLKQYQNVLLLDIKGRIRMQTGKTVHKIGPETGTLAGKTVITGQASFSDFYYCTECQTVHLDVLAPVIHYNRQRDSVVGVIILRIEPENLLYPLIQQWPVPSKSAETYLVRRDNGEVLYLTELRFQKGSAAKLRHPLSRKELPEVMAINGSTGNVTAVDYRGKKVYAYLHNMPANPWYIIAKTDRREAEAIAWFIGFIVIVLIIAAGGVIGSLWNRQQKSYFRNQLEQERERQALSKHYEYLTKYANDIILLLDEDLNILEANDKAVAAYGYSREKILTLDIYRLRKSDSRSSVDDQYRKVVDDNGLLFEAIHKRSDGSTFPVEVSARMMEVEGQKYFQIIIRDISERKRDQEILQSQKEELEAANEELMVTNQKLLSSEQELIQADEELRSQLAEVQESRDALERSQTSLKRMEEMFDQFLKYSPVYVFFKDENIRPLKLSRNYEQMLGRPLQELLGRNMDELFPSDLAKGMVEDDKKILREGKVIEVDEEFNGRHYRTIKFPILQEGRPKMLAGFTMDVTEQKRSEEALRKSEERFKKLIDTAYDAIFIADAETGMIIDANAQAGVLLGMPVEQIKGMHQSQLHPSELAEHYREVFRRHLESGRAITENLYVCRKDGARIPVDISASVIELEGRRVNQGVFRDITQRKRSEEAHRKSEERFRQVAESAGEWIWEVNMEGLYTYSSPAVEKILGYSAQEIVGQKHFFDLFAPEIREEYKKIAFEVFAKKESFKGFINININKNGEKVLLETSGLPVFGNDGALNGYCGADTNVTEREKAEEQIKASLKEKEVLLREIHHRVKNNLQVISSLLNLQSGYITDQRALELFKECQTRVRSMSLIHERLYQSEALSRLSFSGYAQALIEDLFHSYGADRGMVSYSLDIINQPMKIDTAIPCGLIVNELVSNSLKYAFPGYHKIGRPGLIKISLVREGDGSLALSVSDNGIGMPQGFNINKVESLGLQLVTTLVEQLDGRLEVKNKDGACLRIIFRAQ
jgi:PAS domain S-box-containing protein